MLDQLKTIQDAASVAVAERDRTLLNQAAESLIVLLQQSRRTLQQRYGQFRSISLGASFKYPQWDDKLDSEILDDLRNGIVIDEAANELLSGQMKNASSAVRKRLAQEAKTNKIYLRGLANRARRVLEQRGTWTDAFAQEFWKYLTHY